MLHCDLYRFLGKEAQMFKGNNFKKSFVQEIVTVDLCLMTYHCASFRHPSIKSAYFMFLYSCVSKSCQSKTTGTDKKNNETVLGHAVPKAGESQSLQNCGNFSRCLKLTNFSIKLYDSFISKGWSHQILVYFFK